MIFDLTTKALEGILDEVRPLLSTGQVARYIPALSRVSPARLGVAIALENGGLIEAGESRARFTIQSISKVLALAYAIEYLGEEAVFERVGTEPTGDPFNSIIRLETSEKRRPFNPMINAGAIVIAGLLPGQGPEERVERLCHFVGQIVGREDVALDEEVYRSEKSTGARNRSIAWFLNELGLVGEDVEGVLDGYFRQCSISLDAVDLARVGAMLAKDGLSTVSGERLVGAHTARIVKSYMMTCGLYTGTGKFGIRVGLPAKSGVGGGLIAAVRNRMGIATYGPALDLDGNSVGGIEVMARLAQRYELSVL